MSTLLSSSSNPEEICLQYSKSEQESIYASFENGSEATDAPNSTTTEPNSEPNLTITEPNPEPNRTITEPDPLTASSDKLPEFSSGGDNIPEVPHIKKDSTSSEVSVSKVVAIPETSPFKQSVRGFVLNRLSKRVGSHRILSGLTEKLVKRLEEGKDGSTIEKSVTIPLINEPIHELPIAELKSVVADDLLIKTFSVEEATECIEEAMFESKLVVKHRVVSRSLPSSPAHAFMARNSIDLVDNSSDSEEKSSLSEPLNALTINDKDFLSQDTSISNSANEIELIDINARSLISNSRNVNNLEFQGYLKNAYSGSERESEKTPEKYTFQNAYRTFRTILASISVHQWLLLISIFVHKYNFLGCYLDYIFDAIIILYISFIVVSNRQEAMNTANLYPTYHDTQLETATIDVSEAEKLIRGSVKILKGDYDPDEQTVPPLDTVSLLIEDNLLKILAPPTKDQTEADVIPHEVYELSGAKVSLVPKGLTKNRLFNKKYPICITLPPSSKKVNSGSCMFDNTNTEEKSIDFISLVAHEDGLVEMLEQKALYFFALTSREKEAWYQALTKAVRLCDSKKTNQPSSPIHQKFDVSSMSFSSLLETNSDENLSLTEDSLGTESETNTLPSDSKLTINFADYMETIWENYQRVLQDFDENSQNSDKVKGSLKTSTSVEWLNVAVGRVFYDFMTQKKWSDEVMVRIQKKLDKIDLPNFVGPLTVTEVFMGSAVPQLHAVSSPIVDNFGIWFDFDFTYSGSFHMTLTTRLQIPKERQLSSTEVSENASPKFSFDASDTSEDESSGSKRSPKHKLINKIEKWVANKQFQSVAQNRYVKKFVGDISNVILTMTVEVNLLQGVLTINLPPAPTDRLWYAFKKDPILSLSASPKVGSREINLSGVIQMIEKKLKLAFKKAIVMPHMDDLVIPIMHTPAYNEES
ncbi:hypothetical protein JTE90_003882 [Oedothorax gibbosus]|uniref:SMP-LTD domain-containing protein n=1 Tax=Oedothorax gibbosus TaxID=931172 RepID=A0AAV6UH68_9ARAC|nr:hypothetical protein JTE90_003882 [Oedothorax gibbosus]